MFLKLIFVSFKALIYFKKLRIYILLILFVGIVYYYSLVWNPSEPWTLDVNTEKRRIELILQENIFGENGTGCKIPILDPFSEEVMKYDYDVPKVLCKGQDWVECKSNKCYVIKDVLDKIFYISCAYRDIIHVDDNEHFIGPITVKENTEIYELIKSDHVKVSCNAKIKNTSMLSKLISVRWSGNLAGFRQIPLKKPEPGREATPDILFLGFDSASHNSFMRRLPKRFKFIKEELDAVIFNGYNAIGDKTTDAMFPLLTGRSTLENLTPKITAVKKQYFDPRTFIFHTLREDGYRTAYFEDFPGTFLYNHGSFYSQPTDHYLHSILMEEKENGNKSLKGLDGQYCMGAKTQYAWILDLIKQFFELDGKRFMFTHMVDIYNMVTTVEDDLIAFLKWFRDSGRQVNTLLVIFGNHGERFSDVRLTIQGRLEERLPFLAVVLPDKLKQDRPEAYSALKANADVLTTPFDVHSMILDVVGMKDKIVSYRVPGSSLPRGMSLLEPIPSTRTCGDAGVMPFWCACAKWYRIEPLDPIYSRVGTALAEFINKMLEEVRSLCAKMQLTSIESVFRHLPNLNLMMMSDSDIVNYSARVRNELYRVKIIMSPGKAVYEASILHDFYRHSFSMSPSDISRINRYGDEAKCVAATRPDLNNFCYCNDYKPPSVNTISIFSPPR